MCFYSLHNQKSRLAKQGETLVVRHFGGTHVGATPLAEPMVAACLCSGTELTFVGQPPTKQPLLGSVWKTHIKLLLAGSRKRYTATFVEDISQPSRNRDTILLPDGERIPFQDLMPGQHFVALTIPAKKPLPHDTQRELGTARTGMAQQLQEA